jgi:putative ABC transport system permease protein
LHVAKLAGFFTVLALFISCLGLLGPASFIAEQRTKEIGVRKVLGASNFNFWQLLCREFVFLIILPVWLPCQWHGGFFINGFSNLYTKRISPGGYLQLQVWAP